MEEEGNRAKVMAKDMDICTSMIITVKGGWGNAGCGAFVVVTETEMKVESLILTRKISK